MIFYMNKAILLILSLGFLNLAQADISISGYQEYFAGSADQSIASGTTNHGIDMAGLSNGTYTRLTANYNSTLDSGIELNGIYTMAARDCMGNLGTANCGVTNFNSVTLSGSFGSIGIGEMFDVGASMFSRLTASVPTAEPDGANISHFYTGGSADTYNFGSANETNYAANNMKAVYNSNIYSGFSVAVGYTPNNAEGGSADDAQATTIQNSKYTTFSDIITTVAKYSMEMDGVSVNAAYGMISGNAGQVAGTDYNDLEETVYSIELGYAGFTADYRKNEADNSGQIKNNQAGNDEGTSICAMYSFANIGLGACQVDTNFTDISNFDNSSKTRTYSADYNLGGGVKIGAVYFDVEQTANNVTITDADGLMTMLAVGF